MVRPFNEEELVRKDEIIIQEKSINQEELMSAEDTINRKELIGQKELISANNEAIITEMFRAEENTGRPIQVEEKELVSRKAVMSRTENLISDNDFVENKSKHPSKIEYLAAEVMPSQEVDRTNQVEKNHYVDVNDNLKSMQREESITEKLVSTQKAIVKEIVRAEDSAELQVQVNEETGERVKHKELLSRRSLIRDK